MRDGNVVLFGVFLLMANSVAFTVPPDCTTLAAALENCSCQALTCQCCIDFNLENRDPQIGCIEATYIPSDIRLNLSFKANDKYVFQTKIDPGTFPICPPMFPPFCLAFNRVHLEKDNAQVCSEIKLGPINIFKVPCITYKEGGLSITANDY